MKRRIYLAFVLMVGALLLYCNIRLYVVPPTIADVELIKSELAALRGSLTDNVGAKYPEGFFFCHALYGLTWVDVGLAHAAEKTRALAEARWALEQLKRDAPRGIFTTGWTNRLRLGIVLLDDQAAEAEEFKAQCERVAEQLRQSSDTPYLESYPNQAWPCDTVVAVSCLGLHDRIFPARYDKLLERFVADVRDRFDLRTGLIPHQVDARTGRPLGGARATSQSIIARFLPDIDAAFARDQYLLYRAQFLSMRTTLPGMAEYGPVPGAGDVDSGPLILGVSTSATVVTRGAALLRNDQALAQPLGAVVETFGFPLPLGGGRRYFLGTMPEADAFMAWSQSATPWKPITVGATGPWPPVARNFWRMPFHCLSLAIILSLILPLVRRKP